MIFASPYPWFGGKRKVADVIWRAFGHVDNYVEPFFGSGAVLLGRPDWEAGETETINDIDGMVCNFWRSLRADPDGTARWADYPVIESDLEARHVWLVQQRKNLTERLNDPDFFDAKIAGWWVWGLCAWIGGGWCSGKGPWILQNGRLVKAESRNSSGVGISRQLPHLGDAGRGLNADSRGDIHAYFSGLSHRLRGVRVCCGDWQRVCGPSVTYKHGLTAVLLDPPYADTAGRTKDLYALDCLQVAHRAKEWAVANGNDPRLRIALCGYDGEHVMPSDWRCHAWYAGDGYGGQAAERSDNGRRERIWFSPHCLEPVPQFELFDDSSFSPSEVLA